MKYFYYIKRHNTLIQTILEWKVKGRQARVDSDTNGKMSRVYSQIEKQGIIGDPLHLTFIVVIAFDSLNNYLRIVQLIMTSIKQTKYEDAKIRHSRQQVKILPINSYKFASLNVSAVAKRKYEIKVEHNTLIIIMNNEYEWIFMNNTNE